MKYTLVVTILSLTVMGCGNTGTPLEYPSDSVTTVGGVSIVPRTALDDDAIDGDFHLTDASGAAVTMQLSDRDGDGAWDELLVPAAALAEGLTRYAGGSDYEPEFRTNIRMAERSDEGWSEVTEKRRAADHIGKATPMLYQMEGPAWENENVGFRLYFDERNGTDIWGKKTRAMILDSVGWEGDNYHAMADWGMDILKVGNSLGAGGIALMINDSVVRLGDTREERFRILEEGPLRSRFVVEYRGWEVDERSLDLDWVFSITAGTNAYEGEVTVTGLTGGEELLIGIVNLHSDTLYTLERDGRFLAYTHGPQAEGEEILGMALSIDESDYLEHGESPETDAPVTTTYYLKARLENGVPFYYRFTAGWAPGNAVFAERQAFEEAIE